MTKAITLLIPTIKAGRRDDLLRENRTDIIAHLTREYDPELAKRLEKIKSARPVRR